MVAKTPAQAQETAVGTRSDLVPLDVLREIKTPADLEAYLVAASGVELSYGEEISDGFDVLENKDRLIDVPLILVDWNMFESKDFGGKVLTIRLMTLTGERYRISDGSTGIMAQLLEVSNIRVKEGHKTPMQGLGVRNGLRKSSYWVSVADGKAMSEAEAEKTPKELKKKAETFYLNF